MSSSWLDQVKWNEQGLVPVIAQDAEDGRVLMVAWMNREALKLIASLILPTVRRFCPRARRRVACGDYLI